MMHFTRKTIIIMSAVAVVALISGIVINGLISGSGNSFTLSGTIEATEIHLSTRTGGQIKDVYVNEGDTITTGENLWLIYSPNAGLSERVTSPINGVVLERLFEPGELAAPSNVVMVVADIKKLILKVYVPEDLFGQYTLGQIYPVSVDSFPNSIFQGKISHIANEAQYTPRNVQTVEGRKSTVYAITLDLTDPDGKLIPGMPADVHF